MVLGDAASKLKTFVWILNYVFKSVTWSLIDQKASYLDRWRRIQNMDPRSMDHPCGAGPWTPSWARSGQFVGLICSGEGLDDCNELIFEKRVIDKSLWSHQIDGISVYKTSNCLNQEPITRNEL